MTKPKKKKKKNTKTPAKSWTGAEASKLSILADQNATAKGSGLNIGRTTGKASGAKGSQKNVSLNPTKQSSYSRRKK